MKTKAKIVNRLTKATKPSDATEKPTPYDHFLSSITFKKLFLIYRQFNIGESARVDDFEQTVEKGKKIKEKIRRMYEEKFTAETIQRDSEFANEIIQAASFMGKNVDLYGSEEFNPK